MPQRGPEQGAALGSAESSVEGLRELRSERKTEESQADKDGRAYPAEREVLCTVWRLGGQESVRKKNELVTGEHDMGVGQPCGCREREGPAQNSLITESQMFPTG